MDKQQLPEAQQERLDELISDHFDDVDAGRDEAALAKVEQAWSELPEPRGAWDYYSQVLPEHAVDLTARLGQASAAAQWLERLDEALQPHSAASEVLYAGYKGKVLLAAGQQDLAWANFNTVYQALGARSFSGQDARYLEFYRSYSPSGAAPDAAAAAPSTITVPPLGGGIVLAGGELDHATHERVVALAEDGDNLADNNAPADAARSYVQALELLPQPRYQWEAALQLYTALGDALLDLTQYDEAYEALQAALQSGGQGNPYVWLRLGDAHRGLGRDGEALEAYTSAYMLAGEEIFEDEDGAWAMLEAAGIPV